MLTNFTIHYNRKFKAERIKAARRVLKKLAIAPKDARDWSTVLGLGSTVIHILNTCIIPQHPSKALMRVLDAAAYQIAPDAENVVEAEWAEAAQNTYPWTTDRGAYFIADLVKNPFQNEQIANLYFLRLSRSFKVDHSVLVELYGQASAAALRKHFGLGSHRNHRIPNAPPERLRLYKGKSTLLIEHIALTPRGQPLTFGLNNNNIAVARPTAMSGIDVHYELLPRWDEEKIEDVLRGSLVEALNRLYVQLAYDIMAKSPNRHVGPPYTTLTPQQLLSVSPDFYMQPVLPFDCVTVEACNTSAWIRTLEHLLPDKGYCTPYKTAGYSTSTYYQAWLTLLDRLKVQDAALITRKMRSAVSKFLWLPRTEQKSMWTTESDHTHKSVTLSVDEGEDYDKPSPSPVILANPRYVRHIDDLDRFQVE